MRRRLLSAHLVVLLTALGLLAAPQPPAAEAVGEPTFTNPLNPDGADPWLEYFEGNYYLTMTTWSNQVQMRKSPTLAGLRAAAPVTIWSDTTPGRNANMWAPDMRRLVGPDGRHHWYYMYTMGSAGTFERQYLHVLESVGDDPMGPYRYRGRPIPTDAWNIDGSYVELGGQLYVAFSAFSDDPGLQNNYIARMSNPWTADTALTHVLSQPTEAWETVGSPVNEGPVQLSAAGREHIVYSASFCGTDDYTLGMLTWTGGDPLQRTSWVKSGPVFTQAPGAFGPGHNGFFSSPDGSQIWNVYHANPQPGQGCARSRSTRAQVVTLDATGTPQFGTPVAPGAASAVPSGERGPLSPDIQGAGYHLVNRNSGQCAVVAGGSLADGGDVRQGPCSTAAASTWVVDPTADGYYRLSNAGSDKVLDSAECGRTDGTDARQWAWLANECQQWRLTQDPAGWTTITNRAGGLVLDTANCSTAPGADVRQWRALGNACQQWALRPLGALAVVNAQSGKVFDLPNCTTAAGAVLQQHQWLGSPCQRTTFTPTTDGFVEMRPASTPSLCLGVRDGSTADGAAVVQGPCGVAHAQWRVEPMPDGTTRLVARHSGKVLDLAGCGLADGTALRQWSELGNPCQRFRLAA